MANINSVITYNANLSPAQAQIKALTGQVGALSAAFNTLDKSALSAQRTLAATFAANVGQIGGFTAQTVKAHTAVENFGKQLAANRLTMREYFREAFTGYTKQNSMLRQLAEQQVRYQQSIAIPTGAGQAMLMTPQSINAASSAAQLASQRFSIFNQLIDGGATKMLNWGKNTQWAGRQLMVGFTMPLMLFTAVASKQFRDLDKELTRFQKVYGSDLGGAISESTQRMREEVQQLAYDISRTYGIAAKDTAALAADIAATGAEGEQLMSSVQQTTRFAVLGEVDRQEAMKATLALQSAFKMNTNELAESINFLNAVENQTSATLEDLATAIPKVGPVVRSLGGDVKDLATLLVAMREGGIPAAEAANALKSGLASLINPTKQASEVAKQFGVDLVGIVESNKGQLMPTIFAVRNALAGLDDFARSRVIEQIFGKYQFARISALFDNIGRTGSQTQSVLELAAKSSTDLAAIANQEIKVLTESTAVKFQRTLEQLKNSIMPIGQALTETLIPIFEFIGKGINTFSSFFQSLPEPIKNFTKYGIAIAALAGPVIMLVGLFGNLIANGIKFGMMIVRLGAKITGLKVEKFEILNAEVMAAKLGIDNLTASFTTQETAMKRLVGVMSAYEESLRRLSISKPALFIPGAVPGPRGIVPVKRQSGSQSPEKVPGGYGGGDKIPALLEPGEMVVRKEAAAQYAPIISAMNRGNLPGYIDGTDGPLGGTGGKKIVTPEGTVYFRKQQSKDDKYQWRYSRPSGLENLSSAEQARMHLASTGGEAKNLIIRTRQAGSQYLAWLDSLFIIGNQFQNQFENLAAGTGQNARIIQQNVSEALRNNNVAQDQIDRIITNLTNGVLQHEQDLIVYKSALQTMSTSGLNSKTLEQLSGLRTAMQTNPNILTGSNPQQIRGAIQTNLSSLTQIRSIMNTPEFRAATTAGQLETKALLQEARTSIITATRNLMTQLTQLSNQAGVDISSVIEQMLAGIPEDIRAELMRSIDANSPSRRIQPAAKEAGKSLGDGAVIGLQQGLKQSTAGRRIVAGPVGGGGIESISNAQKIAQADQSILKLKEMQLKHTADRVRAEVELGALQKTYARGEISIIQFKEQERQLASDQKTAAEKELRIQNIINQQKQRIADADAAQLRAEQEEARNASRRAVASMVAPGGLYGAGGYNVFGTVGRQGTGPGPKVPTTPTDTGPNKAIRDSQNQPGGMRGVGAMNAAMGASMLASTITMFSGATSEASSKIMMFTTALTTAIFALQTFSGTGIGGGIVGGVKRMGGRMNALGGRATAAAAGRGALTAGLLGGGGKALTGIGGALAGGGAAAAGTVAAVAIPLIITAAGLYMYKKSLDEAKEIANAAFSEPAKTAEFFGKSVDNVTETLKDINAAGASEELSEINSQLRMAVSEDYAALIEKLKTSVTSIGAADLGAAYTKMIISGMSAEEAQDAIKAIAAESGYAGGLAYSQAFSQGLLDAKTPEEAYNQTIAAISPGAIQEQQNLARDAMRQRAIASPGLYGRGTPQVAAGNFKNVLAGGPEFVQSLKASIEMSQTAPEIVAGNLDKIRESYLALNEDAGDLFGMGTSAREMAFDEFKNMMAELDDPVINELLDQLQNSTAETQALAIQMTALGIPLTEAKNAAGQFDDTLARAAIDNASRLAILEKALNDAKQALVDFAESSTIESELQSIENSVESMQNKIEDYTKSRQQEREAIEESFEAEQKAREDSVEAMQDEMDAKRESFEEEMDQLDKKSEKIKDSSDAYIESLQKNQRAESFFAQQRKTSFGALEKLASGDVFGFLQEREQMSQDAQAYSYDQMIEGIEERRDLELDSIDNVREKRRKEQEDYEKMMEDKIDSIQKVMDKESEMHEENMKNYDDETKKQEEELQKRLRNRTDRNKDAKELIDGIKNGEIKSYREVTKVFGIETGKRYEELVKAEMAALQLKLQAQVATGDVNKGDAERQLLDIYNSLVGAAGYQGPEASRRGAVTTYGSLQDVLGLPGFITRPPTKRAEGGKITGPGGPKSDVIPAMLSNGEYVIQASSVKKYGTDLMDSINAGRFADGGIVQNFSRGGLPAGTSGNGRVSGYITGKYGSKKMAAFLAAKGTAAWFAALAKDYMANKKEEKGRQNRFADGGLVFNKNILSSLGYSLTTAKNVERHLDAGGWPLDRQRLAWTIAMRESGGNPKLYHDHINNPGMYSPGNGDYGLFQVNKKGYGSQPWFNIQKLLDGDYNSSVAYKYISRGGKYYLPWALKPEYNGTSAGFDWGPHYGGRPSWGADAEKRTNAIWSAVQGQTSKPGPSQRNKNTNDKSAEPASIESPPEKGLFSILSLVTEKIKEKKRDEPSSGGGNNAGPTEAATKALNYARQQLGKPYSFNAQPPESWDCSKLTAWAWNEAAGKNILTPYSHTQATQLNKRSVGLRNGKITGLSVGDVLYFKTEGPSGGHTSIYAGSDKIIQASSPSTGVITSDLNSPWNTGINPSTGKPRFQWAGPPKGYAMGGFISGKGGPRSDIIPAMLSNGEYVVKASSVEKYGKGFMDQLNAGQLNLNGGGFIPKFADGGIVGSTPMPAFNMPEMASTSVGMTNNNYGGNTSSNNNSTNVRVVINGASGKNANAIANKVVSMINSANSRRNHSRSI